MTHHDARKKCILLVEDDPSILKMTKLRLEHEGFKVIVAVDGEEALQKALTARGIDLMVMDVRMPKLDGFQVCKRIRQSAEASRIPIIVYTASVTPLQRLTDRCIELGVAAWLRKPFRSKDLMATVYAALRKGGRGDG